MSKPEVSVSVKLDMTSHLPVPDSSEDIWGNGY